MDITTISERERGIEAIKVLQDLHAFVKLDKIIGTFLPNFNSAPLEADGMQYLYGNFNAGGTKSGRLSSSDPNLQQIPSTGSPYAKVVKSIFGAPIGFIFGGADFNSLEDYISALTTKDPAKLSVYIDGYDGHCLRAYYYFRDELVGITDDVDSINSIATKYPKLRQRSKGPTFALTYQGTEITLENNLGMSKSQALQITEAYHDLYQVSDQYIQDKLIQATKDGYVTGAFGLRLRTHRLKGKDLSPGKRVSPLVAAEGRTAGNMLGQSYGMLNNRAAIAFMREVLKSPYREDIRPVALIHDAIYLVWRSTPEVTEFVNTELVKAMQWQELPELHHDKVKLGAALDIFYPSWADDVTIPNYSNQETIIEKVTDHVKAYNLAEAGSATKILGPPV